MDRDFDIENGVLTYYSGKEQTVKVPDGVTEIAEHAFVANETVTEVILPSGVIEIGESAFASCKSLQKIDLPASLAAIGDEAFYGCSALTDITLPADLTCIGESAFAYCESLKKVTVPSGVKTVSKSAFESCSEISELTLCEGIEKIELDAFTACVKISALTFPKSLTYIGRGAFCACAISELYLHDGITHIGSDAFHGCERLTYVHIGKGVTQIGKTAFGYCGKLTQIEVDKGNECFAVKGNCLIDIKNKKLLKAMPDFEVPADGSVTAFADEAFGGMPSLRSFEVPAFIEKIEEYVFADCERLRRLTVHRDNKYYHSQNDCIIENSTGTLVAGCNPGDIPKDGSVKIIAGGAFGENDELTQLSIPEGVTELKEFAFSMFAALRRIKLPESLVCIGNSAFMDCKDLQTVDFGGNVQKIDDWTFAGCESLTEIELPESLRFIGENAFFRVPLARVKFRAPKHWFMRDFEKDPAPVKLKNPQKAAALITEPGAIRSFERKIK